MSSYVVVASKLGVTVRDDLFGSDLKACADNKMNGIVITCIEGSIHVELYDAQTAQRHRLSCAALASTVCPVLNGLDKF